MNIKKDQNELINFINSCLKPNEEKKKENGEVFTPIKLIEEMINKLEEADPNIFTNPNLKWLDPASGMGNFQVVVYMELMKGLKTWESNEEKRRKWILEEMLYMVEYDRTNVFMMKRIFCGNTYRLNIFHGSFIDGDRYIKEGIDIFNLTDLKRIKNPDNKEFIEKIEVFDSKFDVIMGNPPFQATDETGKRKAQNHNLWSIFLKKSFNNLLKYNGYLLFITPISWMTPDTKYKDTKIFYNNYIVYLNINECKKWFDVGSEFSYYIIKKTIEKENTKVICKYKNKIYKNSLYIKKGISYLPKLVSNESLSILDKFYNNKIEKISFNSSSELHRTTKKNFINKCDKTKFIYKIRHTTKNTDLCSSFKHLLANKNKILINLSANLDPLFDKGKLGFTQAQMYFLTDNKEYVNILNSKLYKFIFQICKWSGFNNVSIFKEIPYIETFKDDKTIYKLFKLSKKEIELINNFKYKDY